MQNDWAAENLQTIRTLMERSALYRRALAPVMTTVGLTGIVGAVVGAALKIQSSRAFVIQWMIVCAVALIESFLLIRRQAMKDAEPLWSAPTRRVAQAMLPAFFVGFVASIPFLLGWHYSSWLLVPIWMVLHGCALHAAGNFMPGRFKLFGWGFVLGGCACALLPFYLPYGWPFSTHDNECMGVIFGGGHLAYGIYLYFTERTRNAA